MPNTARRRVLLGFGLLVMGLAGGADGSGTDAGAIVEMVNRQSVQIGRQVSREFLSWYRRTPPMERITWGGLAGCGLLGVFTLFERGFRLRRKRVVPPAFVERFQKRLSAGQLDRGKSLDYCELNPSAASRVALAVVQRWGRPAGDLERGASLAKQREVDRLRRNVGTLRRIAALAPLIGLLGTLTSATRSLAMLAPGTSWGPVVAAALGPLTIGVALAILALVLYDGLTGRVEYLAGELDRIGAETVDAVALRAPVSTSPSVPAASPGLAPTVADSRITRNDPVASPRPPHVGFATHAIRIPVQRGPGEGD